MTSVSKRQWLLKVADIVACKMETSLSVAILELNKRKKELNKFYLTGLNQYEAGQKIINHEK